MKHDLYKLADQHHLNANEQQLLQAVLETAKNGGQCSVREFAAQNYTSPAAVIRLSKKMGYTGYTDMIYRIGFLIQNEIDNKNHASDITAFIGGIPEEKIHRFVELLHANRQKPILVDRHRVLCPFAGIYGAEAAGSGLLRHRLQQL